MRIRENRYEVSSPLVRAERKILVISDVHGDEEHMAELLRLVREGRFDAGFLVGDVIDDTNRDNGAVLEWLEEMGRELPIFYAPGNHEFKGEGSPAAARRRGREFLRRAGEIKGCSVLQGDGVITTQFGEDMGVASIEVPEKIFRARGRREKERLTEEYMGRLGANRLKADRFNILMIHTPEVLLGKEGLIPKERYDGLLDEVSLVICGHMHGGLRPRWTRGNGANKWGWVGPYTGLLPRNAFGYWSRSDYGLILSDGVTKFSNHAPVWGLGRLLNLLYIPDVEVVKIIPGERYRLRSLGSVIRE